MGIPDEDRVPYRHAYGDYTHLSRNGQYRFEWTPLTPAIQAWKNAEHHLKAALDGLAEARKLPGFALNGLAEEHGQMMKTIDVLADDARACHAEAGRVVEVLQVANADYANANEASLEEYRQIMATVDLVRTGQTMVSADAEAAELATDAAHDKDIFPFDGTP